MRPTQDWRKLDLLLVSYERDFYFEEVPRLPLENHYFTPYYMISYRSIVPFQDYMFNYSNIFVFSCFRCCVE